MTTGTRIGSGQIVMESYDEMVKTWGGSSSTKPLSFGAESSICNQDDDFVSDNEEERPYYLVKPLLKLIMEIPWRHQHLLTHQ